MKKRLIYLLLVVIIANLAACCRANIPEAATSPDNSQTADKPPTINPPATDPPPTILIPPLYNATIEYGEPDLITDNTGPLWAYIRYPVTDNETDEIIADWARGVYQNACDKVTELRKGDPEATCEINVQFDSYLVNGKYAGILENGIFMGSHLAHPISIVRTFNIDTNSGKFLDNTDILDFKQLENVFSVMRDRIAEEHPDSTDYLEDIDDKWIDHITIGHDGIIVILERGVFLPAYFGTLEIILPYEKLGSAFILGASPEPPAATPTADPTTTPTISPTASPTETPSASPSATPSETPTETPSETPTASPTETPSETPTANPTETPSETPTANPTAAPTAKPTAKPTETPTKPPPKPIIPNVPPQSGDIDPSKPMVALTFDDGPSKNTAQILDILEKYGAHATFCVVGNLVDARKSTVKRAFDLGCEIIGHSWDHRDLTKLTVEEIENEINDTSAVIESITGVSPKLYRPPYGAVNDKLKSVSAELGYAMINWCVDPMDWHTRDADKVHDAIMADTGNRAIVLSHDLYVSTADAMERVIPELLLQGYQLVTVSELMYYSNKTLEAGVVYHSGK